jgi:hypothetical protein
LAWCSFGALAALTFNISPPTFFIGVPEAIRDNFIAFCKPSQGFEHYGSLFYSIGIIVLAWEASLLSRITMHWAGL